MADKIKYNYAEQEYKGIRIKLIQRNYRDVKAKRYVLIPPAGARGAQTNQNVWIPNKHTEEDGTLKPNQDLDYVFRKAQNQLNYAGYTGPIIGIKRTHQDHMDARVESRMGLAQSAHIPPSAGAKE